METETGDWIEFVEVLHLDAFKQQRKRLDQVFLFVTGQIIEEYQPADSLD